MNSASLQSLMNKTKPQQWAVRRYGVTAMSLLYWRSLGMPCIVIKGDKRPVIRYIPTEADQWVRAYRKGKRS